MSKEAGTHPPLELVGKAEMSRTVVVLVDEVSTGRGGYKGRTASTTPRVGLVTDPVSLYAMTWKR